jgi:hypothetical protein
MTFPLLAIPLFLLVLASVGYPFIRLLSPGADLSQRLMLAPIIGLAVVAVLLEPTVKLLGPLSVWAWVFWLPVVLSALLIWRETGHSELRPISIGTSRSILGILAIYLALISLPFAFGVEYSLFRTNVSDAGVNIAFADLWLHTPWPTIKAYLKSLSVPDQSASTIDLLSTSPAGIFSARFVAFAARLTTGMMIGLYAALFGIPTYQAYLPLLLAMALLGAILSYGLMRLIAAPYWLALVVSASVIGGWDYIVRESDNSNQFPALPLLVGALYVLILKFDKVGLADLRSGILLGIVLAGTVTIYPEVGLIFGAAVGAALLIRGVVDGRPGSYWLSVFCAAGTAAALLVMNGQVSAIVVWFRALAAGELMLSSFIGPTGDLIQRAGLPVVLGIYPFSPALLPVYLTIAMGVVLAIAWGALRSLTGLAIGLYFLVLGLIAFVALWTGVPYSAYRAASFAGMIGVIAVSVTLWNGLFCHDRIGAWRKKWSIQNIAVALIVVLTLGGVPYWALSFGRRETGYSTVAERDWKAGIVDLRSIKTALGHASGGLGLYMPALNDRRLEWNSQFLAHLIGAQHGAIFLSGFFPDNGDLRLAMQQPVYAHLGVLDQPIQFLLVSEFADPVPKFVRGQLMASDGPYRLYSIEPMPIGQLLKVLDGEVKASAN